MVRIRVTMVDGIVLALALYFGLAHLYLHKYVSPYDVNIIAVVFCAAGARVCSVLAALIRRQSAGDPSVIAMGTWGVLKFLQVVLWVLWISYFYRAILILF